MEQSNKRLSTLSPIRCVPSANQPPTGDRWPCDHYGKGIEGKIELRTIIGQLLFEK